MSELILGRYRTVRRLAQGGMGVVYLGRVEGAAGFSKPVVIKKISADAENMEESKARFVREAQILSHLRHPGIVGVLDFGQEGDTYAMVLEYVHGYDLGRWIKYLRLQSDVLPWEIAAVVTVRVLEALHYAHTFCKPDGTPAGVLHRDISPGNIMVDLEGQVRLLDFGIARTVQGDAGQYKTQEGVLQGKVGYLAPELFGAAPPSTSSDLYACGVVLYQLLTGVMPFEADSDPQLLWKVVAEPPRPLHEHRKDLSSELESIVIQSLDKQPRKRFESAEVMARALRSLLPRAEADIVSELRERLRHDFTGEMPDLLQLDRLSEREQTWRSVLQPEGDLAARTPQRVSLHEHETISADVPMRKAASDTIRSLIPDREARVEEAPLVPDTGDARGRGRWLWGAALALSCAALVLAISNRFRAAPAPAAASRFIVVESPDRGSKPGVSESPAQPALGELGAGPSEPPLVTEPAAMSGPVAPAKGGRRDVEAKSGQTGRSLSERLAQHDAALERCFEQHAAELVGQPQISVTFEVEPAGNVRSATLEPAALNRTKLGECLLGVARQTKFGPQPKAIGFSIPLKARAVPGRR